MHTLDVTLYLMSNNYYNQTIIAIGNKRGITHRIICQITSIYYLIHKAHPAQTRLAG